MTMFFNLEVLEAEAGSDIAKFVALLNYHFTGTLVKHKSIKYKPSRKNLAGYSFILNAAPILNLKSVDIAYVVQYIKLAARRDYTLYKFNNYKALDISYFPEIRLEVIKHNPLLKIVGNHIFFKFEESYNGTIIQRH